MSRNTERWLMVVVAAMLCATVLPAALRAQEPSPKDMSVDELWGEFLHYVKIGRPKLAQAYGKALIAAKPDPVRVLELSEKSADSFRILLLLINNKTVGPTAKQLLGLIDEGRRRMRSDPKRIAAEVERLSRGTRAWMIARDRLVDIHGEYAVPQLIAALDDPQRENLHAPIVKLLPEMGKEAVNPLVAALEIPTESTRIFIVEALGKIGYWHALPYLKALLKRPDCSAQLKQALTTAIKRIDPKGVYSKMPAARLFLELAERYYYDKPSLKADPRFDSANVWFYSPDQGVYRSPEPTPIFNELMCMRCCEKALQLDPSLGAAVSLWISAYLQLEDQLPKGTRVGYFKPNHPDAFYYAVAAGPEYLHSVLARALRDDNAPVALGAIKALEKTAGEKSLLHTVEGIQPLVEAMNFPDREVRFSAAIALAAARPTSPFTGSYRVVPILAQAVGQTGKRQALVLVVDQDRRNAIQAALRDVDYQVTPAHDFATVLEQSAKLPSVDLVVLDGTITQPPLEQALAEMRRVVELKMAPTVVIAPPGRQRELSRSLGSSFVRFVDAQSTPKTIISAAQAMSSTKLSDPDYYSKRAVELLREMAVMQTRVFDFRVAEPTLIAALSDNRTEIQTAAADVLALIDSPRAQKAIAALALDESAPMDVRNSVFESLANSAKTNGNYLEPDTINRIFKIMTSEQTDPALRTAAAKAYGALNLPPEKARDLILLQHKAR